LHETLISFGGVQALGDLATMPKSEVRSLTWLTVQIDDKLQNNIFGFALQFAQA